MFSCASMWRKHCAHVLLFFSCLCESIYGSVAVAHILPISTYRSAKKRWAQNGKYHMWKTWLIQAPDSNEFPPFRFFFRLARGSTMYMNCVWYVNGWQSCRVVIAGVVWLVGFVWSENGFGIGVMIITVITIHWFPIYNGNVVVDVIIGILMRHFSVVWMRSVCVCFGQRVCVLLFYINV